MSRQPVTCMRTWWHLAASRKLVVHDQAKQVRERACAQARHACVARLAWSAALSAAVVHLLPFTCPWARVIAAGSLLAALRCLQSRTPVCGAPIIPNSVSCA